MHGDKKSGSGKKVIGTIILVLILALIFVRFVIFNDTYRYNKVATSVEEINNMIDTAMGQGKGEIYFTSAISPAFINFDAIILKF